MPLKSAQLDIHTPFAAYARVFDAWGKSAKFDAVVAGGCLDGTAEANGVPVSRDVCGLLDPTMRVSVNLYGAPALEAKDFATYRQDLIVGASLQLQAPLGQYDPSRLVNLGSNRWAFRPEVGASTPAAMRSRVVFPQPEWPSRQTISPGSMVSETPSRARWLS